MREEDGVSHAGPHVKRLRLTRTRNTFDPSASSDPLAAASPMGTDFEPVVISTSQTHGSDDKSLGTSESKIVPTENSVAPENVAKGSQFSAAQQKDSNLKLTGSTISEEYVLQTDAAIIPMNAFDDAEIDCRNFRKVIYEHTSAGPLQLSENLFKPASPAVRCLSHELPAVASSYDICVVDGVVSGDVQHTQLVTPCSTPLVELHTQMVTPCSTPLANSTEQFCPPELVLATSVFQDEDHRKPLDCKRLGINICEEMSTAQVGSSSFARMPPYIDGGFSAEEDYGRWNPANGVNLDAVSHKPWDMDFTANASYGLVHPDPGNLNKLDDEFQGAREVELPIISSPNVHEFAASSSIHNNNLEGSLHEKTLPVPSRLQIANGLMSCPILETFAIDQVSSRNPNFGSVGNESSALGSDGAENADLNNTILFPSGRQLESVVDALGQEMESRVSNDAIMAGDVSNDAVMGGDAPEREMQHSITQSAKRPGTEDGGATSTCNDGVLDLEKQVEPPEVDALVCPICMEPWTNTGSHRICSLACGHLFGKSCIKRWLKQAGARKKFAKCPHCNRRARIEDLRTLYVSRVAVMDGEGLKLAQEVSALRAQNRQLKLENTRLVEEIHRTEALLDLVSPEQLEAQRTAKQGPYLQDSQLHHARQKQLEVPVMEFFSSHLHNTIANEVPDSYATSKSSSAANFKGMGVFAVHARQPSQFRRLEPRTGENHFRKSIDLPTGRRNDFIGIRGNGQTSQLEAGFRSRSSLACIGSRGVKDDFILQNEVRVQGAKVFDMDADSQIMLVSHKRPNGGGCYGLTKISLLALSEGDDISLPPGSGAIRDIRICTSVSGAPGKLALVASLGKKVSLFSMGSNNIVVTYSVQSPPWSCAWDPCDPNQVYCGLQNGSLVIFDMRQTSSPIASLNGLSTRPIHTLQAVPEYSNSGGARGSGGRGILSASSSSLCFWDFGAISGSQSEIVKPFCLSDARRDRLCVSLVYNTAMETAVASFRPKPVGLMEASSSCTPEPSVSDVSIQARSDVRPGEWSSSSNSITKEIPIHCPLVRSKDTCKAPRSGDKDAVLSSMHGWVWDGQQQGMVGHQSHSLMPRSTIIAAERKSTRGSTSIFACGDEGTNAVWLWDMHSMQVTQQLIPHQSPVSDVKNVQIGGGDLLGCISEGALQLYRRFPSIT